MRVLIDVGHPAQVHFFKNLVALLTQRGHLVTVTARPKDVTTQLLDALDIPWVSLGTRRTGTLAMAAEYSVRLYRMLRLARHFKPDVMLAQTGVTIGPAGLLLGVPRIVLEEAEHARLQRALGLPFATRILTGTGYLDDHGQRQVRLNGFWVEAYLDQRCFTPDPHTLKAAGVDPDQPFILLRTVSCAALHDVASRRARPHDLRAAVTSLSRFGRVLISSEDPLPQELAPHANPLPIQHMHHLLAHATLCIGDGGTIAAESAILATPTVYCSPLRCGYLHALAESYRLIHLADSLTEGVRIAEELLRAPGLRDDWRRRRAALPPCEDITQRIYEVVEETVGRHLLTMHTTTKSL